MATRVFSLSPANHRLFLATAAKPARLSPVFLIRHVSSSSSSSSTSSSSSYAIPSTAASRLSSSSSSSSFFASSLSSPSSLLPPASLLSQTQVRHKSTIAVPVGGAVPVSDTVPPAGALDFNQVQIAFASRTTLELIRAWTVFKLSSIQPLVKNSRALLSLSRKLVGDKLTTWALKQSFFGHFCGGETAEEVYPLLKKLKASGIKSILDYAAEAADEALPTQHQDDEAALDKNVAIFLSCIETASAEKDGFAAAKLTALAQTELLEKVTTVLSSVISLFRVLVKAGPEEELLNHTLTHEQLKEGLNQLRISLSEEDLQALLLALDPTKQGSISLVAWVEALSLTELSAIFEERVIPRLTPAEQTQYANVMRRVHTVAQAAANKKVRLMIDAEQTYYQRAIDHVVITLQQKYNKEFPVIFNTYQGYLRDAGSRVNFDLFRAKKDGFIFAAKTVRGAYMQQERDRAGKLGYRDPIQPDIAATHNNYNHLVQTILKAPQMTELMIASHNEESVRLAISFQQSLGSDKNQRLYFGQLYGMCDHVSYTLGKHGYEVYKYLPYGPVHEVLPYLIRRAEENSDFLGRTGKETDMLADEIKRRLSPF